MKLLLAEDDAILSDALTAQLQGAGYEVEHAPNGAVADYLLHKQAFDIAVLDIGLPMLDGLAVLQHVRQSQPALPVLLLTARDALDDRVAGLQAGADDYVTKPFDLPELLARIDADTGQELDRSVQPLGQVAAEVDVGGDGARDVDDDVGPVGDRRDHIGTQRLDQLVGCGILGTGLRCRLNG